MAIMAHSHSPVSASCKSTRQDTFFRPEGALNETKWIETLSMKGDRRGTRNVEDQAGSRKISSSLVMEWGVEPFI